MLAPTFLILMGLVPSSWLKKHPRRAAVLGTRLATASLITALLALLPLSFRGPVILSFNTNGLIQGAIYYDNLSAIILLLVSLLSFVILRYSQNYLEGESRQGLFTRWICLAAGSVLALVIVGNLVFFAVAWIAVSLFLHQLLIFYPEREGALLAARKKFVFSRLGDACLLGAMGLIYYEFKTFDFQQLFQLARQTATDGSGGFTGISILLVLCALLKSAQFPFHSWLPDTMETPTPVSALMHAGIINAGGFLIIRFSPIVSLSSEALVLLAAVGGFTALFASLTMLTHASVKRALAFSTVAQMGFMMLECGLGAYSLAVLHLVAHSLYKAHAFLSSGSVLELRRSAWVPDSHPRAHPVILIATLVTTAFITFGTAWAVGVDLWKSPSILFLGLVFWFSLAYMLWNLWSHGLSLSIVVSSLALTAGAAFVGFMLHQFFAYLLVSALSSAQMGWTASGVALTAFPCLLFLVVLIFQTQLPAWSNHPLCRVFYIHARNGFYFTTLANRFVMAFWPLSQTPTRRPSAGERHD